MVDVLGHLGMALIWLAIMWYIVDDHESAATLIATGFWFGALPDVDVYLSKWFQGIHHHGVFHTVLVVTLLAAVLGPALGWVDRALFGDSDWFSPDASEHALSLGFVTVWVAGLSHLFGDMLSAPDISQPIEPFWPLYNGQIVLMDLVWYNSPWVNWGLLVAGLLLNGALWYWAD